MHIMSKTVHFKIPILFDNNFISHAILTKFQENFYHNVFFFGGNGVIF